MLSTLRRRLILSHVLPLLLLIPLLGLALTYVLGTLVLVPSISRDLREQAELVAQIAGDHPEIWSDPGQAQDLVRRMAPPLTAGIMLLDSQGRLLASDNPDDAPRIGQPIDLPNLPTALAGHEALHSTDGSGLTGDLIDMLVPVARSDGQILGVVRLTHRLIGIGERFDRLRYLIAAVLAAALVLGTLLGWLLAVNLARPLRQVTEAVSRLAGRGEPRADELKPETLPVQGPAEIRVLLSSVNTLVARLYALERNRRQLLASLVHELGRPLGALKAAIDALAAGAADDPELRGELLSGMSAEMTHLRRLLDDLAQLHDHDTGALALVPQSLLLDDWLPGVLATWREAATARGLHWEAPALPDLPVVAADPDRLAQAIGNLLSNAVKYTPRGGKISITAGCSAPRHTAAQDEAHEDDPTPGGQAAVWIRVADTGPGIAPEEHELIFDPLYRGRDARHFPQGMGLGLTIARDLVKAHGGRLSVESARPHGSVFTIWLPAGNHAVATGAGQGRGRAGEGLLSSGGPIGQVASDQG